MGKVCGEHSRATVMSKQRAKARHQTYILKKEYEINSSYEEEERESTIIILEGRKKGKWEAKEELQHADSQKQINYFLLELETEVFCIIEVYPFNTIYYYFVLNYF